MQRNLKIGKILIKVLDRTRSARELRKKTTFSPRQSCMVVLTFEDLNNHEYLIPPYPEEIVEPKETGK